MTPLRTIPKNLKIHWNELKAASMSCCQRASCPGVGEGSWISTIITPCQQKNIF